MPPRKRPPTSGRKPRAGQPGSVVGFRAAPDERTRYGAAANREGLTLSDWLRAAAELALARGATR